MKGMGQGREIREGFPEVVTLGWAPKKSGCELREETEVDTCGRREGGVEGLEEGRAPRAERGCWYISVRGKGQGQALPSGP